MAKGGRTVSRKVWAVALISVIIIGAVAAIAFSFTYVAPARENNRDPGALVSVKMNGQVGVLLDEIPNSDKSRAAKDLMSKPADFWLDRAKDQIRLMSYRLVFRDSFYDENESKGALP